MLALYLSYIDNDEDKNLFEKIFYDYRKQMVIYSISILKHENDAEDVVHDVFLKIANKYWDTVKSITDPIDLRNYLLKATKNTSLNKIKNNQKKAVLLDTFSEFELSYKGGISDNDFFDIIYNKIEYEKIVKAIEKLKNTYRDALYYHFVLEMSVKETAKVLNQSVSTTQKQLVRGKKMLISLLGIKGDENYVNEQK
ncbi:MAG: RNA polymerase sigma factor [Oscillospiraceae bacterium]|nr:RNA polymerase sigma factor [Oscillospiraceae bacterium]